MTKHEILKHLLAVAARAAHLQTPIEITEECCDGGWGGTGHPCLNWQGMHFHPENIAREIRTPQGMRGVLDAGWVLSYEQHFGGSWDEPPSIDLVEFARCSSEWSAATTAVIFLITEGVQNAVSAAVEAQEAEMHRNILD
jgi:hypothetical protein